ncbi:GRP1 [Candida margitis]|uniref:GRP1 n=1 Tax=Candida margitis TaxID=1775924 RepID=UPI00222727C2|nr:GRP1 [Candida margitis]KAI5969952.1 GRP1 [Candida margitis]
MTKVFVTGASGFIAQHIVKLLLESGYEVVGTVRSKEKGDALAKLVNNQNFQYVIVPDIGAYKAFDESLKQHNDVSYILHTASPFTYTTTHPEQDLIIPAIQGTRNILNAADTYAKQLKRLVITSSDAAIYSNVDERNNKLAFNEQSWNNIKYQDATVNAVTAYYGAKSFAEKSAWEFMEMKTPSFTLSAVNPSYVFGPQAYHCDPNHLNESNAIIGDLLNKHGNDTFENEVGGYIDVRDVAKAHVFAITNEDAANRRLFMNNGHFSVQMMLDIVNQKWPELNLIKGTPCSGPEDIKVLARVDNSATRKLLQWKFIDLETMVIDTVQQISSTKN